MVASEPFLLDGLKPENSHACSIEATVTSGFESVARDECQGQFENRVVTTRGRIAFDVQIESLAQVLALKCVDNVYVLIGEIADIKFKETKEECLQQLKDLVTQMDWKKGLNVWKTVTNCDMPLEEMLKLKEQSDEQNEQMDEENKDASKEERISILSFRVSCNRVGNAHSFQSPEASANLGSEINEHFGWKVDLTNFDLEVVLNICCQHVYVSLALTKESLHKRNLEYFGPTTLRPTISHCMLRLACIEPGDVVCDPMCGSGSIVVEGATSWAAAFHLCGDIHDMAWPKTLQNIDAVNKKQTNNLAVDVFKWDATRLPLSNNSIDVIVTDLPFGKKMGSKYNNKVLYPKILNEFGRVCKLKTGRAVLLTADRPHMFRALKSNPFYWKITRRIDVNIGGLTGSVFVLQRNLNEK